MEIPANVRELLWEYRIEGDFDPSWENIVLERVMQRGGWSEMRWLLRTFERGRLMGFLSDRGCRLLAPRELRFWAFACGVADDEQDAWVVEARRHQQRWRG